MRHERERRVILIKETIMKNDLKLCNEALESSLITLRNLYEGVTVNDMNSCIDNISRVSKILNLLSENKIKDAKCEVIHLENRKKMR